MESSWKVYIINSAGDATFDSECCMVYLKFNKKTENGEIYLAKACLLNTVIETIKLLCL
jgi:hypothetical protein